MINLVSLQFVYKPDDEWHRSKQVALKMNQKVLC